MKFQWKYRNETGTSFNYQLNVCKLLKKRNAADFLTNSIIGFFIQRNDPFMACPVKKVCICMIIQP